MTVTVCIACDKNLPLVDEGSETNYHFDNALWIGFHGGYGMFVDNEITGSEVLEGTDYEAVLCHACAHELCDKNPWIKKLLKPWGSHAHKYTFWENEENIQNHEGWDHPTRGFRNDFTSPPEV